MASYRNRDDPENAAAEENADVFSAAQRRALGDLGHFTCRQNPNEKWAGLTNGPCKAQDETRTARQIKNEKNIVGTMSPVTEFRAFSVYEDEQSEVEAPPKRLPLQEKKDVVESPMSVGDASILPSMSTSKNESEILEVTLDDSVEDTTTAQTDRENFFHVVEYRQDIYKYLREIEVKYRVRPGYMRKQPDITHGMRSVLVDWLVDVCVTYDQQSEALHLAVSYVDRFLSNLSVVRSKLQLLGTAATFIATKYEGASYHPGLSEFVYITDDTYTKREILRMEEVILKMLSFDLSAPTALAFLSHYCISSQLPKKTFHLAAYIAELSLLEGDPYLQYKPSEVAAAALATACHALDCRRCATAAPREGDDIHADCSAAAWPAALAEYAGYGGAELEPCLRELARTHAHAPRQPYQAIVEKYRTDKYDSVSSIAARPMCWVAPYAPPAAAAAAKFCSSPPPPPPPPSDAASPPTPRPHPTRH